MHTLFSSSDRAKYGDAVYAPIEVEEVSAEEFMDLLVNHRSLVKDYWIQLPNFGDRRAPFGTFVVEYHTPLLTSLTK